MIDYLDIVRQADFESRLRTVAIVADGQSLRIVPIGDVRDTDTVLEVMRCKYDFKAMHD